MVEQPKKDDDKPSAPSPSIVLLLLSTVADTTLRLFVPSVGGTVLGLFADTILETKPWFTVIGVTFGTALAFWLVYDQIKKVKS